MISIISVIILSTRRKSVQYCTFLFILFTVIFFIVAISVSRSPYYGTQAYKFIIFFIYAFIYIIYLNIILEEALVRILFTVLSVWMISNVLGIVCEYIAVEMIHRNQALENNTILEMRSFVEPFVRSIGLGLFIKIRNIYKRYIQVIDNRTLCFMSLYPFVGVFYTLENYRVSVGYYNDINIINLLLFTFFVVMGYVNVGFAIISTKRLHITNSNIKLIESQINLQRENYKTLIEFTEERAKQKHDLRHHITAVKSMLETGKSENALQYIQQFDQSYLHKDIPVLCMNLTADSLIKHYMSIALNKGIDFRTKLNLPEDININPVDLSVILGNCIENAINACDKLSNEGNKYIELKSDIVGQQFIMTIKNSFNGILKKDGEAFISSNHDGNGIGTASVMAVVKKYKGDAEFKYNHHEFKVDIILIA